MYVGRVLSWVYCSVEANLELAFVEGAVFDLNFLAEIDDLGGAVIKCYVFRPFLIFDLECARVDGDGYEGYGPGVDLDVIDL